MIETKRIWIANQNGNNEKDKTKTNNNKIKHFILSLL